MVIIFICIKNVGNVVRVRYLFYIWESQIKRRYEIWTFLLECSSFMPSLFMLKPSIHTGFRHFLSLWARQLTRCVNIQKSLNKTSKNNFWTPVSIFLSLLACHNTRLHKHLELYTPTWNVDVPYYRNPCIFWRFPWILLPNDNCSDITLPV